MNCVFVMIRVGPKIRDGVGHVVFVTLRIRGCLSDPISVTQHTVYNVVIPCHPRISDSDKHHYNAAHTVIFECFHGHILLLRNL